MAAVPNAMLSQWFAQAVGAMQRRDFGTTARLAQNILTSAPGNADVHHLLAVAQMNLGDGEGAAANYEAALRGKPNDPAICTNYASLLKQGGEDERALSYYRRALAKQPDFFDALMGVGLVARRLGLYPEAEAALGKALKFRPGAAAAHQALGLVHMEMGNLDKASSSFGRAGSLSPQDPLIILSQAKVEAERGGDASPFYERAARIAPYHPDVVLGRARVALERNDPEGAVALIEAQLRRTPNWLEGHQAVSKLRWQYGGGSASTASYEAAILARPDDFVLRYELVTTLHAMGRYADATASIHDARTRFGNSDEALSLLDQLEAVTAGEAGDLDKATLLFERSRPEERGLEFRIAYVRHLLRTRRPEEAAALAEQVVQQSGHGAAWAYLGTAWRILSDPRCEWLEGDPRLVSVADLADILPHLDALAATLRHLHISRVHPFEQSLRGGTQTEGSLLPRAEPEVQRLRAAFECAVADHIAQLPPPDPRHPTLSRPRSGFRFAGSWSVRLTARGFHIAHVHPMGWLSSAFYVALPPKMNDIHEHAGWLALGQPPEELGLDLPPLRLIKPEPGLLVIFPSHMWHGTVPFDAGERLTIAFDVAPISAAKAGLSNESPVGSARPRL